MPITLHLSEDQREFLINSLDGADDNCKAFECYQIFLNLQYQLQGPLYYEHAVENADNLSQLEQIVSWFLDDFCGTGTLLRERAGKTSWDELSLQFMEMSWDCGDMYPSARLYREAAVVMEKAASMWDVHTEIEDIKRAAEMEENRQ